MLSWWIWLILAGWLVVLLWTTTANLALRLPSRARLAEEMGARGRDGEMESLLEQRVRLLFATASLRAASFLCFSLTMVHGLIQARRGEAGLLTLLYAFLIAFPLLLLFGIAIPNAWARHAGESMLTASLPLLHAVRVIMSPIVATLEAIDWLARRISGAGPARDGDAANELEQEILSVLNESESQDVVDEEQRVMIESVIELRDTRVDETMTPRTEIVAVEKQASLEELKAAIQESGHSRIPVYEGTVDHILGVVHAKDLLRLDPNAPFDATPVMREVVFIPENKQLRELLNEFRAGKGHMAIVLDEYGGTAGLVTMEDIVEEVVGDIVDEREPKAPDPMRRIDDTTVEVDARMRIDELNKQLELRLPENEDYETIGGYLISVLGRVPQPGEECAHEHLKFVVTDAEQRKVNRVRICHAPTMIPADDFSPS